MDKNETALIVVLSRLHKDKRYCRECKAMLPLEKFSAKSFFCRDHYRLKKRTIRKPPRVKTPYDNIRIKCWRDRTIFGHKRINLSMKHVTTMLTDQHLANIHRWTIVPVVPSLPVSNTNAVVVPVTLRRHLMAQWAIHHDDSLYQRILALSTEEPPVQ